MDFALELFNDKIDYDPLRVSYLVTSYKKMNPNGKIKFNKRIISFFEQYVCLFKSSNSKTEIQHNNKKS